MESCQRSISTKWIISCSMILCRASSRSWQQRPPTLAVESILKVSKSGVVAMAISNSVFGRNPFVRCIVVIPPEVVMRVERRNFNGLADTFSQTVATTPSKNRSSIAWNNIPKSPVASFEKLPDEMTSEFLNKCW